MIEIKKLDKNSINSLIEKILNGDVGAFGDYQYKDLKILIRKKNPLNIKERSRRFYSIRRAKGVCVRCGEKVAKNPKTGRPFRYCEKHRDEENEKRRKVRTTEKKGKTAAKAKVNTKAKTVTAARMKKAVKPEKTTKKK